MGKVSLEDELIKKIILFNLFAIITLLMLYRNIDLTVVLISIVFILVTTIIMIYQHSRMMKS
jgi:hypothetical protein